MKAGAVPLIVGVLVIIASLVSGAPPETQDTLYDRN